MGLFYKKLKRVLTTFTSRVSNQLLVFGLFLDRNILIFRILVHKVARKGITWALLIVMVSINMADTSVAVARLSNDGVFSEESQANRMCSFLTRW